MASVGQTKTWQEMMKERAWAGGFEEGVWIERATVKLAWVGQSVSNAGEHPAHWSSRTQTRLHSDHITISAHWIRLGYCDWAKDIKRFHIICWCSFNVIIFHKNANLCHNAKCHNERLSNQNGQFFTFYCNIAVFIINHPCTLFVLKKLIQHCNLLKNINLISSRNWFMST